MRTTWFHNNYSTIFIKYSFYIVLHIIPAYAASISGLLSSPARQIQRHVRTYLERETLQMMATSAARRVVSASNSTSSIIFLFVSFCFHFFIIVILSRSVIILLLLLLLLVMVVVSVPATWLGGFRLRVETDKRNHLVSDDDDNDDYFSLRFLFSFLCSYGFHYYYHFHFVKEEERTFL